MVHRPQPGFWTRSEFDDSVQQCLPPSTARCVGWLSSEDAVQCGTGYQSPSSGCDQCSDGYFPQLSTCLPCPAQRSTIVFTVLVFAGVCLGVFCFILALILVTTSRNDVPVLTAVYRSRDMILWTLMTWQTIVQVGKRAVFVPSELRQFYTWLSVVELDTSPVVHPACYSRYPFTLQSVELGASIVVTVFVTVTSLRCPKGLHVIVRTLRRLSVSFLALFYALATNTALNMVHCTESDSLQGKPALASNPDLQCWSGDHLYVGVLSLFVLMCHTVGFPLVSWLVLSRQARRDDGHSASDTIWSIFVAGDYQRQYFWFPHVQMIVLLSLSVLLVYFPVNPSPELAVSEVSVFAATFGIIAIYCWLLLWKQPFVVKRRWKLPVKVLALSVTLFGSACNFLYALAQRYPSVPSLVLTASWYTVMILSALLVCALVVGFVYSVRLESSTLAKLSTWRRAKSSVVQSMKEVEMSSSHTTTNPLLSAPSDLPSYTPSILIASANPSHST
jgi:hypothetical protein